MLGGEVALARLSRDRAGLTGATRLNATLSSGHGTIYAYLMFVHSDVKRFQSPPRLCHHRSTQRCRAQ